MTINDNKKKQEMDFQMALTHFISFHMKVVKANKLYYFFFFFSFFSVPVKHQSTERNNNFTFKSTEADQRCLG